MLGYRRVTVFLKRANLPQGRDAKPRAQQWVAGLPGPRCGGNPARSLGPEISTGGPRRCRGVSGVVTPKSREAAGLRAMEARVLRREGEE